MPDFIPDNRTNQNPLTPKVQKKRGSKVMRAIIVTALTALVISPVDIIPEAIFGPVGLIDDIAYIIGVIITVRNMVRDRKIK